MKFATSGYLLSLAAFALAPSSGMAQVATSNFTVQITIQAACQINSAGNLNFGTNGVISSNIDATSQVVVQCTSSTPFSLGLSAGAGSGATVANRLMTSRRVPPLHTRSIRLRHIPRFGAIPWGRIARQEREPERRKHSRSMGAYLPRRHPRSASIPIR